MHTSNALRVLLVTALALCGGAASCWDVSYECDVLPNDTSLGTSAWTYHAAANSLTTVANGILRTTDPWTDDREYVTRGSGFAAGIAVTVESRFRAASVSSADWIFARPGFGIQTFGGSAMLALLPDGVATRYLGETANRHYAVDLSEWHAFRIALASDRSFRVWMDGGLVFSGLAFQPGQNGVFFGTGNYPPETADIEWDYVRYSKAYLPLPEPSSLLALLAGFCGLGGVLWRRRTR